MTNLKSIIKKCVGGKSKIGITENDLLTMRIISKKKIFDFDPLNEKLVFRGGGFGVGFRVFLIKKLRETLINKKKFTF